MFDEKPFCCNGCRTVYEILNQGEACEYYSINQFPGIREVAAQIGNKYAYLDLEEIRKQLLDFSDGGISKVKFFIPGIHCSSCIWLLENLHRLNRGIAHSMVNFVRKEVSITFREEDITLRQLVELLASINYVPLITLESLKDKTATHTNRQLIYKLGVAGFCFMNIMLLSFPEYLDVMGTLEKNFRFSFAWFNLILSLPVFFYAGNDYFKSAWKGLRKKLINIDVPIALGIFVLFGRSVWEVVTQTGVGYFDSMSGLVFFLLIGKWYQGKTYQALSFERDYRSYFPVAVTVIDEDGRERTVSLKALRIGQRILVRNQELIPADAILLKGNAHIDYSFVSGESTPVRKNLRELIYAGGRQKGGVIELMVEKEVSQSYLTELWNQEVHPQDRSLRLTNLTNRISRYFTVVVIAIAMAAGITWLFINPVMAMNAFTSVLIVACPCALALTIPFAFGGAMRVFGRSGLYLRKYDVIEQLSGIDTIVFDKTGTITQSDQFEVDVSGLSVTGEELPAIRELTRQSTHPLSVAVYQWCIEEEQKAKIRKQKVAYKHPETEFFSESPSDGIAGKVDGKTYRIGSEQFITGQRSSHTEISSRVYVSVDGHPKGYFQIKNKYRQGLEPIIAQLKKHYDLHLLSGDNEAEMGHLLPLFGERERLHFRQSPVDKLNYINRLKKEGRKVLMIGDGLNDAGALVESDVGITVADDIFHFSPACDAILEARRFSLLSTLIRFSRTSMRIVTASFILSILYNLGGLFFAVGGYLTPLIAAILMPLSSVSVVAFVTVSTMVMARRRGISGMSL